MNVEGDAERCRDRHCYDVRMECAMLAAEP
jgi:hypothetical protein